MSKARELLKALEENPKIDKLGNDLLKGIAATKIKDSWFCNY